MYGLTKLYTGITPARLANIIAYSWICHELPGAFAEFGVMKGGSLAMLADLHPTRRMYGIDSFVGVPEGNQHDLHKKGDFALEEYEYNELIAHFSIGHPNVMLLKGFSPEVFKMLDPHEQFAFVHIDVDMFSSVNDALDYFHPRMIGGGMMLFDDYGFDTTPGAKVAIDQWKGECRWRGPLRFANDMYCEQYLIIR